MGEVLAAGLDRDGMLELWRGMCLHRAAEERLEILQKQGHVQGSVYRGLGQEAGSVGAAYALRRRTDGTGDFLAQTVREAGALFLFGGTLEDFFRQYMAKATGPTRGRESNVHWVDWEKGFVGPVSPLGTMLEVMAGVGLAFRMRGEDRVAMVFYGDGATSTGAWHEGLSFAAARGLPVLVMVEANQYAFSTPTAGNTRLESFTEKAEGYGIGAESVDGTDVLAVYEVTARAARRARGGGGPQMVELRYFRRKGHAQHDPQDYVPPELLAEWEEKDPLDGFRRRILEEGWAAEEEIDALAADAEEACRRAAETVVDEPLPEGEQALEDVYTDVATHRPWTRRAPPDPTDPRA